MQWTDWFLHQEPNQTGQLALLGHLSDLGEEAEVRLGWM